MTTTSKSVVLVERESNGVTWVYMNRPDKRNAMNPQMHVEMVRVLDDLQGEDATRVVVLTGTPPAFCAGQDIRETFREGKDRGQVHGIADWRYRKLFMYPKPTIAAVNGWCCGGAFTQLFSCDFAIASRSAMFCLSEINWGIIPGGLVGKVVTEGARYRDGLYAALLAEPFDGDRAAQMGFVNFAVEEGSLHDAVMSLADKILAKNPATYRATKEAIKTVRSMSFEQAEEYLKVKSAALRLSDSAKGRERGMSEFLDKKSYRPGIEPFPSLEHVEARS